LCNSIKRYFYCLSEPPKFAEKKEQAMSNKKLTYILLDGSETTQGFSVNVDGVDIAQFERNPVMLYQHDDKSLPIGTWANIRKEKGQLLADPVFDYEDTDADVQRIIGKAERGIIKMASVGLRKPVAVKRDGRVIIESGILREASIVPFGANNNAMRLYDTNDKVMELGDSVNLDDFFNLNSKPKMDKEILELLNLDDGADGAAVLAAINVLLSDKKKLTEELDALKLADVQKRKEKFEAALNAAIKDGRVDAAARDSYLKLFEQDPEQTANLLDKLPKPKTSVTVEIEKGRQQKDVKLSDLTGKSWDELDKSGKLVELRDLSIEDYKEKFKEKFGNYPTA
jgi:hypothetical protein